MNITTLQPYEEGVSKFCSDEHERAVEYCSRGGNNKVRTREGQNIPRVLSWGEIRPYSIISPSLILEEETVSLLLPRCQNVNDYLYAIKYGERIWPYNNNSQQNNDDDAKPSLFNPHRCHVPSIPPPPSNTCDILNQYSHVIFHGDSLTRHLRQAVYMSMRGDYITGGVMTNATHVLEECKCDGQFSEAKVCRTFDNYFDDTMEPRDIIPGSDGDVKLCPNASFAFGKREMSPYLTRKGQIDPGKSIDWDSIDCIDDTYKGIFIVLQGGSHWKSNSTETFANLIQPVITHHKYRECSCLGKVRLIWLAMNAQSSALDVPYPQQSREKALLFNEEIRQSFIDVGFVPNNEDVLIIDWWNMTADAQSSDGLHYLSDINLAKAAQILYLAGNWPFPKKNATTSSSSISLPRQFTNRDGANVTIPEGAPLPPLSFYRQQGVQFNCDS